MSPLCSTLIDNQPDFPRVSGDEPEDVGVGVLLGGFSPRERG